MLLLLKKMMSRFLKQRATQKKSVDELLKLGIKNVDIQLKDSEPKIGVTAQQALKDVRKSGRQIWCYLCIWSFFKQTIAYMQKSLELNNTLIEALTCLHPEEKTMVTSVQKIMKMGNILPCVKPEELTVLTDEWRVYAKTDTPEEWVNKEDGSSVRVDHYWDKVLKLKSVVGSQRVVFLQKS